MNKIVTNKAKCLNCNDELISVNAGYVVECKCGNLKIDGGKEFCQRIIKDTNKWEEQRETRNE